MLRSLGTSETTESQLAPGLPAGAEVGPVPVWKSPSSPRVAVLLVLVQRGVGVLAARPAARPPGPGSAAAPRRSGSARSSAAGRPSRCPGRPASRRRSGCRRRTTSPPRTSPAAPAPCPPPSAGSRSSPTARRHVGQVGVAADGVDGVVELLLAHARALDVAEPLGPAVVVLVQAGDELHRPLAGRVEVLAGSAVAGPACQTRATARRVLRRLVGVARVGVGAEEDRAVRGHLVHDLAAARG